MKLITDGSLVQIQIEAFKLVAVLNKLPSLQRLITSHSSIKNYIYRKVQIDNYHYKKMRW